MISYLNMLLYHEIIIVFDLNCKLFTHVIVQNPGPGVTETGIIGGDGYDVRITCVHGVLMLCSSTLLKGVP